MRFDEVKSQKVYTTKYGPSFQKSNHPLKIMVRTYLDTEWPLLALTLLDSYMQVQYGRLEMLTHPVISSLLQHKWFHFGLWLYLLKMIIYIIFLGLLTAFALVVLPPQSNTCMYILDVNMYNPIVYFSNCMTEPYSYNAIVIWYILSLVPSFGMRLVYPAWYCSLSSQSMRY